MVNTSNSSDPITFTSSPCIIERLLPHSNDSPVISVAAGDWHALALTKSGKVWAWGCNRNLQCGRKVKNGSSGNNSPSGTPSPAPTVTIPLPVPLGPTPVNGILPISFHVTQISAGRSHSMIIVKETFKIPVGNIDGSPNQTTKIVSKNVVYCWGNSHQGQCGNYVTRRSIPGVLPAAVESLRDVDVRQISAGGNHSMALTAQGRILCWGSHLDGQLGIGIAPASRTAYRAATDEESATSCHHSNHLASTSAIQCKPRLVSDLDFVAIAAGQEWNKLQQSADSLSSSQTTLSNPSLLSSIPRITSIHAGATFSTALDSLGQLYVWGSNDAEQLGIPIPKPDDLPYVHEDNNALRAVIDSTQLQESVTNPLLNSRPLHVQTFDSRHNILLPLRVDIICDTHVAQVGCGPNHMWCIGHPRSPVDMENLLKGREYSKTLYEVQVEQQQASSSLWPPSSEKDTLLYPTIPSSYGLSTDTLLSSEKTKSMSSTIKNTGKQAAIVTNGPLAHSSITGVHKKSPAVGSSRSCRDDSEVIPLSPHDSSTMLNDNNTTVYPVTVEASFTATDVEEVTETEGNDTYYDDREEIMHCQSATSVATATSSTPTDTKHNGNSDDMPIRFDVELKSSTQSPMSNELQMKNRSDTLIKRISKKFLKRRKPATVISAMNDDDVDASRSASIHDIKSATSAEDNGNPGVDRSLVNGVVNDSASLSKTPRKGKASERFFGNRRKKENS